MTKNALAMRPRWIVFDAADTLIRAEPGVAAVYHDIARHHGVDVSERDIANALPLAFGRHFPSGKCDEGQERCSWRGVVTEVLKSSDPDLFDSLWDHFADPVHWRVYDDVNATWEWLEENQYAIAIASNFDRRLKDIVRALPPLSRTQELFCSSELGARKPSRTFFRRIASALRTEAKHLLLVGDNLQADFQGARQAGWQALHLVRQETTPRYPQIARLTDLIPLLQVLE